MRRHLAALGTVILVGAGTLVIGAAPALAQPAPAPSTTQWLCNPDLPTDPCTVPMDTTDLGTGTTTDPAPVADEDKPVDCFYVYPTVSDQIALNADLSAQPEVQSIATFQAGRWSSRCRMFAPIYRQMTLTPGIAAGLLGAPVAPLAYADVLAAWKDYLQHDNNGRGVILIGHSQGTMMLRKLVRDEIDPDPEMRSRLVGAFLLGGNVLTARGSTTGGDFDNIPLCTSAGQKGCVVAYSTSVADPSLSLFGNSSIDLLSAPLGLRTGSEYEVACTDPGPLSGDTGPVGITIPSAPFPPGVISLLLGYTSFPGGAPTSESTWTTSATRAVGDCTDVNGYRTYQFRYTSPGQQVNELPLFNSHLVDVNLGYDRLLSIAQRQIDSFLAAP